MSLHMIFVLVPNGSDANLVMMTKFATNFYKKFNELQPLCLTWELSFLSEWFSDQVWSKQILEQCPEILDKVKLRYICIIIVSIYNTSLFRYFVHYLISF